MRGNGVAGWLPFCLLLTKPNDARRNGSRRGDLAVKGGVHPITLKP